ncbi:rod shape-determining protein MreC [Nonlabens dokdonensis]|uniref:Cell shape-determining protein MreC n=1 Tax=Nonlabens dokdonensis TaxID=328515 RepID=A0A1Z8BCA7_9FLAO|nr:rod shape-determining protein MreC [Nonlabens dokdonensis]OUS20224.1 rod shape-determining protein MreC [Nonlabens dokdonensis]
MQQIFNFLIKYRNLLLYLFLMVIAVTFTIQSHDYHRSTTIHSTGKITGGILSTRNGVYDYFDLINHNKKLSEENASLRMRLLEIGDTLLGKETTLTFTDSIPYNIFPARVIKNDFYKSDNYITIDIGANQGIQPDMGVISTSGIVGVTDRSNEKFSRVISILNSQISLNAQIKGTSTIGSLKWDGYDPYVMSLEDVPRLAQVKKGDTIITGKQSTLFPSDILIGEVQDAQLVENGSRYKITVRLFNDMTDLDHIYVIKNRDQKAIQEIDTLGTNE